MNELTNLLLNIVVNEADNLSRAGLSHLTKVLVNNFNFTLKQTKQEEAAEQENKEVY